MAIPAIHRDARRPRTRRTQAERLAALVRPPPFRWARACVQGSAHLRDGLPCQDVAGCREVVARAGERVLLVVASDGAGSARFGELGARLAVERTLADLAAMVATGVHRVTEPRARALVASVGAALEQRAMELGVHRRELACTLLAAAIGEQRAAFVQVGDGAIVASPMGARTSFSCPTAPARGEHANETSFVTDRAPAVSFAAERACLAEVALLTDGMELLCLDRLSRRPHAPFFCGILAPLRVAPAGEATALSGALGDFLASSRVRARTDDDVTLVLASRRAASRRPVRGVAAGP